MVRCSRHLYLFALLALALPLLGTSPAGATTYRGTGTISGFALRSGSSTFVDFSYSGPIRVVHEKIPVPFCDPTFYPDAYGLHFSFGTESPVFWTDGAVGDSGFDFVGMGSTWEPFMTCAQGETSGMFAGGGGSVGSVAGGPLEAVSLSWGMSGPYFELSGETFSFNGEFNVTFQFSGLAVESPAGGLYVPIGSSWDGVSLQEILDAEYGAGAIDVETDYEGYLPGDADPAYWEDFGVNSLLVREIAGFDDANTLGWYAEDLAAAPMIDGVSDGVIFEGPVVDGAEVFVEFPNGPITFGFYLNPNGTDSSHNAPEPELFFTNRFYNDIGPDGSGALHAPTDGDVQVLIFDISHLRDGVPTYVLAWEDLDSGATVLPAWNPTATDNDFNDLVVEISAYSPVTIEPSTWGKVKAMFGGE